MPCCSPGPAEVAHLLGLLGLYGRDEICLRAKRVYQLSGQPDQVSFEVVDVNGVMLRDPKGLLLCHTLQCHSPEACVGPGQLVLLRRDGNGVQVDILPRGAMIAAQTR